MLVLSRKKGEKIYIGSGANVIVLDIVQIRANIVRVAIDAPVDVPIARGELIPPEQQLPDRHKNVQRLTGGVPPEYLI